MATLGAGVVLWPAVAPAWPAIQDATGVYLCQGRPEQQADGRWMCKSGGQTYVGALVEVAPAPGVTPGSTRPVPYVPYYPYPYGPWNRPRGPASGYDELGPWLGGSPSGR